MPELLYNIDLIMDYSTLKNTVRTAPDGPGIYIYTDETGRDIYIGKAASIKKRLKSYLKTEDSRIRQMIERAKELRFIQTESDIEALILESQLIKQKRPDFNIMLRDDKQYFYVAITAGNFPRLFLTHQPNTERHGTIAKEYIGPFTDGAALKATLKYLRSIFPYCTCKQLHNNFCLNYHIGKCIGYCCLKNPDLTELTKAKKIYAENIKAIRDILNGRKVSLLKELKATMEHAARTDDFDAAIGLRSRIGRLERVFENARIIKNSEVLRSHRSELQSLLKLRKPIIRIEGYDTSNIQGSHATGSMVTFIDGEPDKNYYRKFKIRIKRTPDDTAMLREILERRLNHPEWPFPDLILIDGGKSQVNTALKTLKAMSIKLPVIGIAKNEHHKGRYLIIPGRKLPLLLDKLSPADKNLLLAIDGEAHRFAISYYRRLHGRSLRGSPALKF